MIQSFKIRSTIIFLFFSTLYAIISIHMYIIQIHHHDFYTKIAKQQYHVTITQRPPRGNIVDRTGTNFLAMNDDYISAFILPTQMMHKSETNTLLLHHFPDAYQRLKNNEDKHFLFIKRKISPEQQQIIKSTLPHDICLLSEPGRYYPVASAGTFIGITNRDNKGLFGVEQIYDHILAGNPTVYQLEKDARSGYYYFKRETSILGNCGQSIQMTIDADLQFLTQEAVEHTVAHFNAQSGAAIVMDPKNGEVLALVSYPYFDPNNTKTATPQLCKNSIITDAHELGSVIKVCAALAALEENVVEPDELIDCKNTLRTIIDGRTINTVQAHGTIPFTDVIAFSNNIGIATVAKRVGTKLYDHYKKLGFGTKTGIELYGENSGFVNPPARWSKQSIISLSYGYEISATILQLACAFCTIATGYAITPTVIMQNNKHTNNTKLYSDKSITIIKNILEQTTLYGTTRKAAIKGYRIMSKTGTANMLVNGAYQADKNLYTCAGIVEQGDYQRVIVTFIKEATQKNIYASTVAVPLFEKIAERMLIHEKILS